MKTSEVSSGLLAQLMRIMRIGLISIAVIVIIDQSAVLGAEKESSKIVPFNNYKQQPDAVVDLKHESEQMRKRVAKQLTQSWHEWQQKKAKSATSPFPYDPQLSKAPVLWLWLVEYYLAHPDARLFYLISERPPGNLRSAHHILSNGFDVAATDKENWQFTKKGNSSKLKVIVMKMPRNGAWFLEYTANKDDDGVIWGSYAETLDDGNNSHKKTEIFQVRNGKLSIVTPQPAEDDFFTKGKWKTPKNNLPANDTLHVSNCEMEVRYTLHGKNGIPLILTARYEQNNANYSLPTWQCTAECTLTYLWDNNRYVIGKRTCLPKGKWGIQGPKAINNRSTPILP